MKQYTQTEFIRIVKRNGFLYKRHSGDHAIYVNNKVIGSYKYEYGYNLYNENSDGTFYYLSNNSYVAIKKVNE